MSYVSGPGNITVVLLSMEDQRFLKNMYLCSEDERRRLEWHEGEWVIYDYFNFGVNQLNIYIYSSGGNEDTDTNDGVYQQNPQRVIYLNREVVIQYSVQER